jgi:hypothetical protein
MNVRSEPEVRPALDPGEPTCSLNEQGDMQNPEKSKTGTSTKTPFRSFGYREMEKSRVETLQHRSPEVAKCETPKS